MPDTMRPGTLGQQGLWQPPRQRRHRISFHFLKYQPPEMRHPNGHHKWEKSKFIRRM